MVTGSPPFIRVEMLRELALELRKGILVRFQIELASEMPKKCKQSGPTWYPSKFFAVYSFAGALSGWGTIRGEDALAMMKLSATACRSPFCQQNVFHTIWLMTGVI